MLTKNHQKLKTEITLSHTYKSLFQLSVSVFLYHCMLSLGCANATDAELLCEARSLKKIINIAVQSTAVP